MKIASLFVCLSFLSCVGLTANPDEIDKQLREANQSFLFNGKAINPRAIQLFMPWMSDAIPGTEAVYLDGSSEETNQFSSSPIKDQDVL